GEERGADSAAALAEDRADPFGPEPVEDRARIEARAPGPGAPDLEDTNPRRLERVPARHGGGVAADDPDRRLVDAPDEPTLQRQASLRVQDDTDRRDARHDRAPDREERVVGEHGPDSDQDRVVPGPQPVRLPERRSARDGGRPARRLAQPRVERERVLED